MQITGPKINSIVSIIILLMVFFCWRAASADVAPELKTDKDKYNAGETIRVNFFNAPGYDRDWICIVAAGSRDNDAGDYKYMPRGLNQGILTFDAPPPGKYEVRAYYNYSRKGYVVSARYSFSVEPPASPFKPVDTAEITKPVESPVSTYSPAGKAPFNVAVFYFTPLGMDAVSYGTTVTNTLINAPKMQSTFTVLDRKDLGIFLAANNLLQSDEIDNMIEIGTRLGLNFVIAGNIMMRGTIIVTNYKVVNITRKNVIYSNRFSSAGESDLIRNVMKMSDAIIARPSCTILIDVAVFPFVIFYCP